MAIVIRPGTSTAPPPPPPPSPSPTSTPTPTPTPAPAPPPPVITASTPASARSSDGFVHVVTNPAYLGVRIDLAWPAVGTGTVTFIRLNPDGSVAAVRGGDMVRAVNGFAVAYDADAPLGVPVSYYVRREDTRVLSQGATVQITDPGVAVLKPVGFPALFAPLRFQSAPKLVRDRGAQVTRVFGRADPVVTTDVRSLVQFDVAAYVPVGQQSAMEAVLNASPVCLLQASGVGFGDYYVSVTSEDAAWVTPKLMGSDRFYSLHCVQVSRPATLGSPLRIPGKGFRDKVGKISAQSGTYRQDLLS